MSKKNLTEITKNKIGRDGSIIKNDEEEYIY